MAINSENDITITNLLNSFIDVIDYIDTLFSNNDVENAKKAIQAIEGLIQDNNLKVSLDDYTWNGGPITDPRDKRDNVLHALLQELSENNSFIELRNTSDLNASMSTLQTQKGNLITERDDLKALIDAGTANQTQEDRYNEIVNTELPKVEDEILVYERLLEIKNELDTNNFSTLEANNHRTPQEEAEYNRLKVLKDEFESKTKYTLKKEIDRIGDKIFKTAQVRQELSSRNVTRDEFKRFYEIGRQAADTELQRVKQIREGLDNIIDFFENQGLWDMDDAELSDILTKRDGGVSQTEEFRLAIEDTNTPQAIKDAMHNAGITIAIRDDRAAGRMITFLKDYMNNTYIAYQRIQSVEFDKEENVQIFSNEIKKIEQEQRAIDIVSRNIDIDAESIEEQGLREKQIRITMNGPQTEEENNFVEEWNQRIKRFHEHQIDSNCRATYRDAAGNVVPAILNYKTIEDYKESQADAKDGYEDDKKFLNLADYKTFLEITSLYASAKKEENAPDEFAFNVLMDRIDKGYIDVNSPEFFDTDFYKFLQDRNDATKRANAIRWLENFMPEMQKYVDTYHGYTNEHAVKYATWNTAGSTLKDMKPVKGNLPVPQKIKNGLENVGRFFFLRVPKFKDENGNSTILQGIATSVIDLGVIGGVVATGITGGLAGLAYWGAAYAAKGAVTLVNVIRGKAEYKKYKDQIDANLPTIVKPSGAAKEVARKEYYRRQLINNGKTVGAFRRFTTALHAKLDRLPGRWGAARKIEEKIIEERVNESQTVISERGRVVTNQALHNVHEASRHNFVRRENYEKEALEAQTYNELIRDPNSASNIDDVIARVAQNAALHSSQDVATYNNLRKDVNANSRVTIVGQKYENTGTVNYTNIENLEEILNQGGTTEATGITEQEIYTGRQQHQDFVNRIATALIAAGIRVTPEIIKSIKAKGNVNIAEPRVETKNNTPNIDTTNVDKGRKITNEIQNGQPQKVWHETHTENVYVPKYTTKTVKQFDADKSISELIYGEEGYNDVYGVGGVLTHAGRGNKPIDAIAFAAKTKNGDTIELSIAEAMSNLSNRQVQNLINKDISNMSLTEVAEIMKEGNPQRYKAFVEAIGLKENASINEVVLKAAKGGNIYGQTGDMQSAWVQLKGGFMEKVKKSVQEGYETRTVQGGYYETIAPSKATGVAEKATAQGIQDVAKTTAENVATKKAVEETAKTVATTAKLSSGDIFRNGLKAAAVSTLPDTLHEANKQTKAETFAERAIRKRKEEEGR